MKAERLSLRSALSLLLLATCGCTVTAISASDDPRPSNLCSRAAECPNGNCRVGVCQTLDPTLEVLLISATPPTDSGIPHLSFVTRLEAADGGRMKDLVFPGPSNLTGSLALPKDACYPGFGDAILPADDRRTLPVTVTVSARARLLGLSQQRYSASTKTRNAKGSYTFDLRVPQGVYDIYLAPPKNQEGCLVPPQLYRGFAISDQNTQVTFSLSGLSELALTIRWPVSTASGPNPSLVGWTVDIIEPLGGNAISTELVLGEPLDVGNAATLDYTARLHYSAVEDSSPPDIAAANDLLRLRPPAGEALPTILLDRSALGLFSPDRALLSGLTSLPTPVLVQWRMTDQRGGPVSGSVTLASTEIFGVDSGIFASYQTTAQVGEDGVVKVPLPPGKYRVRAVPSLPGGSLAAGVSALETLWTIPPAPEQQFGKVIELPPIAKLTGQSLFQDAQVQAVPSPQTILPFEDALGIGPFSPRATVGRVDETGRFEVQADPGTFDVSVQASDSLGFGWFVRPGVEVGTSDKDLGRVSLPMPALLSGTAQVALAGGKALLSAAAIRAYVYLDKDRTYTSDPLLAVSTIQVAETRADEQGRFRLLVPAGLSAPK